MTDTADRVEACMRLLLDAATAAGMCLSGDLRIAEGDAARLLGLSPGHLKAMRHEGAGPTAYVVGMNGCRVSYRLADLASWIEQGRDVS
jgi:hypothetical protein